MTFLWPSLLWLLLLVPVAVTGYWLLLRRRKRAALRYASLSMVKEAMGPGQRLRRHVPPLLFLLALILMLVAIARPAAVVTLPTEHETIILAIDVSGSMRATDVRPTRLEAAQAAARAFVADQPRNVRIGIVSFAGTAALVQPATENRDDIQAAIGRLELQRATAVGSGILVSLKAIFPDIDVDLLLENPRHRMDDAARPIGRSKPPPKDAGPPSAPGSYRSAAIILLTDGQTTTGPDPLEAAMMAADRGIRVYTVGIGTVDGTIIGWEGWSMRVRLDEPALKSIASITRGQYFHAATAADLKAVYQGMSARMVLQKQETEITALVVAAATVLAVSAAGISLLWFNRIL